LITGNTAEILYTEGDTYIQRYDCFRISPTTLEIGDKESNYKDWQKHSDGVSLWVETFINLDGRSDTRRYHNDYFYSTFDNYNVINDVYSQPNDFFSQYYINYNLLTDDDYMPSTFT
jgi:hypothetical protein